MDKYFYIVRDYFVMIDCVFGGKVVEEIVYGSEFVISGVSVVSVFVVFMLDLI